MIVLATMHNDYYANIAPITNDNNKIPYCKLHGYELAAKTDGWGDNIYFDKIQYLIDIFENNHDVTWIWWLDCDALITNFTKKIEDIIDNNYHIIISTDVNGINCGSFFIKNSKESLDWLKMILSWKESYKFKKWDNPEQYPMIMTYIKYRDIIKLLPQREINSYFYGLYHGVSNVDMLHTIGEWSAGDWVLHLPGTPNPLRIEVFQKMQSSIIRE